MVKISDKHDVFILKSKDYEIDKEDHELLTTIIIDISPLLVKENQNLLYQKLKMHKSKINEDHEIDEINKESQNVQA